jgi:hypothetical protein
MPEPHDFAVRICAVRLRANSSRTQRFCVHRIPPRVRDDSRSAPRIRGETAQADRADLTHEESGIFLRGRTGRGKSNWNRCDNSPEEKSYLALHWLEQSVASTRARARIEFRSGLIWNRPECPNRQHDRSDYIRGRCERRAAQSVRFVPEADIVAAYLRRSDMRH